MLTVSVKRSLRVIALGSAWVVLGLVSCGGDDSSPPSPGEAGAGAAGQPAEGGSAHGGASGAAGEASSAGFPPSLGGAGDGGSASGGSAQGGAGDAGAAGEGGAAPAPTAFLYASSLLSGIQHAVLDQSGKLTALPSSPAAAGHLYNIAATDRFLFTAENDAKRVHVHPIASDGTLPEKPSSSIELAGEPVSIAVAPSGELAFVATSSDSAIHILNVDSTTGELSEKLEPVQLKGQPAVVAIDRLGEHVYVTRLASAGILGFDLDAATGKLTEIEGSPFGADVVVAGALVFAPNNAFLFASGSGVSSFRIEKTGALSTVKGSPFFEDVAADYFATNLAIEPTGRFLYASAYLTTNRITGFAIDPDAGDLQLLPSAPIEASAPYSIAVDPSGRFLFSSSDFEGIFGYAIDSKSGELTELSSSPWDVTGLQRQMVFVGR